MYNSDTSVLASSTLANVIICSYRSFNVYSSLSDMSMYKSLSLTDVAVTQDEVSALREEFDSRNGEQCTGIGFGIWPQVVQGKIYTTIKLSSIYIGICNVNIHFKSHELRATDVYS